MYLSLIAMDDTVVTASDTAVFKSATSSSVGFSWANNFAGWAPESEYAAAAVKVLTSDDPKEVYEFAGPKRSYQDLAAALNVATGEEAAAKQVSQDEYVKVL